MASTANATITAPVGPGDTVTSQVYNNIRSLNYLFDRDTFELTLEDGKVVRFSYDTIATTTQTVSGNISTIAITT